MLCAIAFHRIQAKIVTVKDTASLTGETKMSAKPYRPSSTLLFRLYDSPLWRRARWRDKRKLKLKVLQVHSERYLAN